VLIEASCEAENKERDTRAARFPGQGAFRPRTKSKRSSRKNKCCENKKKNKRDTRIVRTHHNLAYDLT